MIEASGTDFDISVAQLAVLAEAGVESAVIEAMARTSVLSPRRGPATALGSASSPPAVRPGQSFSDTLSSGGQGPEMVVIPPGRFRMGCVSGQGCERWRVAGSRRDDSAGVRGLEVRGDVRGLRPVHVPEPGGTMGLGPGAGVR